MKYNNTHNEVFLSRLTDPVYASFIDDKEAPLPPFSDRFTAFYKKSLSELPIPPGYGTFVSVNGFKSGRRVKEDVTSLNAHFYEIDFDDKTEENAQAKLQSIIELLASINLIPTTIIETLHGFHCWWMFTEPIEVSNSEDEKSITWTSYQNRIVRAFGGDDGAKDISRVLRVPGTENRKIAEQPYLCNIVHDNGMTYTPEEFRILFEKYDATLPQEAITTAPQKTLPFIPEGRNFPGDVYENLATWDEILIPHGWKFSHTEGQVQHWTRPDKASGTSATINFYGNDQLIVFSSNATPFEQYHEDGITRKGYSKFGAYTLLNHNNDFSAAAREVSKKYSLNTIQEKLKAESTPTGKQLISFEEDSSDGARVMFWQEIETMTFPSDRWRVRDLIPKNGGVILAAVSGEGKTWLALEISIDISEGRNFLGEERFPTVQGKVLYIDAENSQSEIQRRGRQLGITPSDQLLFYPVHSLNLNDLKWASALLTFIDQHKVDVVVIDTFRAVAGGMKEEKAEEVRSFFNQFKPLKEKGVCVIWLDHYRKPSNFEGKIPKKEFLFGSQDKTAGVEVLLMMKKEEEEITVYQRKNRLGKEIEPFKLTLKDQISGDGTVKTILAYAGQIDEKDSKKVEAKNSIPLILFDGPKTGNEIRAILSKERKVGERNTNEALKDLVIEGVLTIEKRGRENEYHLARPAEEDSDYGMTKDIFHSD